MLLLPQLLRGVYSVISTCGMCQCDQRARAKHGSVLKRSFITALWLHCSDGDFCSIEPLNQTLQQCQRCAGMEAGAGGVLRWVLAFSQSWELHSHNCRGRKSMSFYKFESNSTAGKELWCEWKGNESMNKPFWALLQPSRVSEPSAGRAVWLSVGSLHTFTW